MPRIRHLALAIVAGLALAVAIDIGRAGGPAAWLATRRLAPPYDARGTLVDVGGRDLYLDCRGQGRPTVVLEAGMGDTAAGWTPVHDAIAATTRTCAYDRAGRGRSDPRGRHTLADAATDLRALLSAAGERGPFVIVGHSLGGCYARVFAAAYRDEVVGLVSVDAFDPDLQTAYVHPHLGSLEPEYETNLDALRDLVARVEALDWTASEAQLAAADLRGLPIEVLRAPRVEPRLDAAANAAIAAAIERSYTDLSPGTVRFELAWGAGHMIQVDRPDLVIAATRRLVDGAREAGLP
ncbi:MAG: alpha/beta fold hydrolase [Candidatus Limnocylindria bacterium]